MALVSIIEVNVIYVMMLVIVSVTMLYVYIPVVYDVFMGRGMEICEDFILFKKFSNMEILSMTGIMMGIIVGVMMMI